jgi:HD-GYP domain-containing protein (c-di-GMP phosphodiesterase class II)
VAEGLTITSEIKRSLRNRSGSRVVVHVDDARRLTLAGVGASDESGITLDSETIRKLDAVIDRGFFPIVNRRAPLRETAVVHGRRNYDARQRQRLTDQHSKNASALWEIMRQVLRGDETDGAVVAEMIVGYVKEITQDVENVLTSAPLACENEPLATNPLTVALLAMAIGMEMGLDADNVRDLGMCGAVHDWGMLKVPEKIRNAPYRLTPQERIEITKHPLYSAELVEKIPGLPRVAPLVVYQIHERPNGQGYPRGRTGGNIHLFAKIIQVADAYTALLSRRPYRAPLTPYSAMECLVRQAKDQNVDPQVVRALLRVQSLFPLGSYVALSDGSVARVLRSNGDEYTRPVVQRLQDAEGNPADPADDAQIIDLTKSHLQIRQALPTPGSNEIALNDDIMKAD